MLPSNLVPSRLRWTASTALVLAVAALLNACGDDHASSTPTPTAIAGHALADKTGNADVDRVLGAIADGDLQALVALAAFVELPCATDDKLGGPPKCATGVAAGTPVKSFPMGQGCEGSYVDETTLRTAFATLANAKNRTYAVYRQTPHPGDPSEFEFPRGEFVIVQAFPVSGGPQPVGSRVIHITAGRIVTVGGWCLQTLSDRVAGVDRGAFLLAPP